MWILTRGGAELQVHTRKNKALTLVRSPKHRTPIMSGQTYILSQIAVEET